MTLDAEKTFDLVSWKFLYRMIEEYEFHQPFIVTIYVLMFLVSGHLLFSVLDHVFRFFCHVPGPVFSPVT